MGDIVQKRNFPSLGLSCMNMYWTLFLSLLLLCLSPPDLNDPSIYLFVLSESDSVTKENGTHTVAQKRGVLISSFTAEVQSTF